MKSFVILLLSMWILCYQGVEVLAQGRSSNPLPEKNPFEFSDMNNWSPSDGTLCVPEYSAGCGDGDGFTDFAVEEIENYGSGCANLDGTGWSQYLGLGPAVLFPGVTHDFIMQTGYNNQQVTIWIDFNDDYDLTSDEKIITDFEMTSAGQLYTVPIEIPSDATPGLHYMRARTNWNGSCNDPCQQFTYGEAEDYYVVIGLAEAGAIEGFVTEQDGGSPVENAEITLDGLINYTVLTGPDGYYNLDYVFVGDYEVTCFKAGYNVLNTMVTIEEEVTLTQDFELTHPTISVDPLVVTVTLPPNGTASEAGVIENEGDGPLDWSASIQLSGKKDKGFLDLQFQYPVAQGGGEAGIETDGNYIYTAKWNGNDILKYDLEGNFMETFTGPAGLRDLAYDGTYFYGGAGFTTVWEMDFETQSIISSFTAPANVRAIAYNDNEDVFYANNYSSPVVIFDHSGLGLGSFDVGPVGENYYGFAYDAASPGGPFLWGYAQTGDNLNEIIQMQLPSGTETGLTLNIKDKLSGPVFNMAGGLFTHPNMVFGKWTLGGLVQNEWIWGLELGDAQTWLFIQPNIGTLAPGTTDDLNIQFDASGLAPGEYQADIIFTSYPDVGNPVIEVTLIVNENVFYPCDLLNSMNCTDVHIAWSVCPDGSPDADSFYVYRDDAFLGMTMDTAYSDLMVNPEVTYAYKVTAFYNGLETSPSAVLELSVPLPGDLEPTNLEATIVGNMFELSCDLPAGCLIPYTYNLYRDGEFLASNELGIFQVDGGYYEYFVTAVYYFGESGPSNTILITDVNENASRQIRIYPNPVSSIVYIQSPGGIENIQLLDQQGVILLNGSPGSGNFQIPVDGYAHGVYFLKITSANKTSFSKLLIN